MIGYFPDPYPDELPYSIFARFFSRTRCQNFLSSEDSYLHKFNLRRVGYFFPNCSQLLSEINFSNYITPEVFLQRYSLFPYCSAFLPLANKMKLLNKLSNSSSNYNCHSQPICVSLFSWFPSELRYCFKCFQEDRSTYGEAYWHRLHQCPGVIVCPKHNTPILNSNINMNNTGGFDSFHIADKLQPSDQFRMEFTVNGKNEYYLQIAKIIESLLNNDLVFSSPSIYKSYIYALRNKGLTLDLRSNNTKCILDIFQAIVNLDDWDSLFLGSPDSIECYVDRIISPYSGVSYRDNTTLANIIFITSLGYSINEFIQLPATFLFKDYSPESSHYLSCMNPTCKSFLGHNIKSFSLYNTGDASLATVLCKECKSTHKITIYDSNYKERMNNLLHWNDDLQINLRRLAKKGGISYSLFSNIKHRGDLLSMIIRENALVNINLFFGLSNLEVFINSAFPFSTCALSFWRHHKSLISSNRYSNNELGIIYLYDIIILGLKYLSGLQSFQDSQILIAPINKLLALFITIVPNEGDSKTLYKYLFKPVILLLIINNLLRKYFKYPTNNLESCYLNEHLSRSLRAEYFCLDGYITKKEIIERINTLEMRLIKSYNCTIATILRGSDLHISAKKNTDISSRKSSSFFPYSRYSASIRKLISKSANVSDL